MHVTEYWGNRKAAPVAASNTSYTFHTDAQPSRGMALSSEFHMPGAFHADSVSFFNSRRPDSPSRPPSPSSHLPAQPSYDHGSFKRKRRQSTAEYASTTPPYARPYVLAGQLDTSAADGGPGSDTMGESVAGSFTGFHATGGGRGYDIQPSVESMSTQPQQLDGNCHHQSRTSIPGRFPDWSERFHHREDEMYSSSRESTPAPAPKRRQTTADELGRNWVMVHDTTAISRSGTPEPPRPPTRNRNHGPSVTTGRRLSTPGGGAAMHIRRPGTGRLSLATTPASTPASSASFASARSASPIIKTSHAPPPLPHTPRRQHHHRASLGGSGGGRRRSNSTAPTPASLSASALGRVGKEVGGGEAKSSPRLDEEVRKLAARRRREAQNADVRMNAFSKTIQDMIRQGQEALATTVEVQGDDGDGKWEDEFDD
ncbi:hypothetical protein GMORB2_6603 [Geosmithia morbida]|uniref:Uncharacterized protein n=1 Tax=Geosmithia morbida TaxID=1094350 RepID=A0A9P4YW18_9HYPO|nr:uncharacterized protein GMORB2_6603 [Geosmithia morbida]KAF4123055.1 hypothetical protein GMORB2_6603 [Geosmithia morbida]